MTNNQYFLFLSNNDIYAIETSSLVEIVEYQIITKVPMMNNFVKGVTNIRGNIMAVVDLLQRFDLEETILSQRTSLAILKKEYLGNELNIAIIIDEVFEIENISNEGIELTPSFGTKIDKRFINGMVKYKNDFIPILDVDVLLDIEELASFLKNKEA
jgi:purine-binding chemotaxis protein CheW